MKPNFSPEAAICLPPESGIVIQVEARQCLSQRASYFSSLSLAFLVLVML
jgi:hypothetical protein